MPQKQHWLERWQYQSIIAHLNNIEGILHQMAISQSQFDTDLAALLSAIQNLITAVDALIASSSPADLTKEDSDVQAAAANVVAELNKLNPPTPVTPPAPTP
jgi:hypothetical protein